LRSFTRYLTVAERWWGEFDETWGETRGLALRILEEAAEIEETARIIGEKALPDDQRLVLLAAEMLREGFLVQSAFHDVDTFCPDKKQYEMLRMMLKYSDEIQKAVSEGVHIDDIISLKSRENIARLKTIPNEEFEKRFKKIEDGLEKEINDLIKGVK